jgi:hypothetical protein
MESLKYVQRSEGEYGDVGGHFFIDCACGSDKGCSYENIIPEIKKDLENSELLYKQVYSDSKIKHTFYINNFALKIILEVHHDEKGEDSPLVLICRDCGNKFPLTMKFYEQINEESKRISKKLMKENRLKESKKMI